MTTHKILASEDGKRRISIVQRDDGNFGLVEEYWYENVYEGEVVARGWAVRPAASSIFANEEIAEFEARASYPWAI